MIKIIRPRLHNPWKSARFLISGIPPQQWATLFPPPLPFSQVSVEKVLVELRPVIIDLFGGSTTKPLVVQSLIEEVSRDFEPMLNEFDRKQLKEWVQRWSIQQGFILAE